MEVHHHSHTSRKKWTHYFWEFLMLFLAVFCGFLAENQREHYIEHQRELQYMRSMIEDLKSDTSQMTSSILGKMVRNKMIDSLVMLLGPPVNNKHLGDIYFYARSVSPPLNFFPNDRTIQQLKSSGALRLIRNQAVSDSIMNYDRQMRFQLSDIGDEQNLRLEYRKSIRNIFDGRVFMKMLENETRIERPINDQPLVSTAPSSINDLIVDIQYVKKANQIQIVRHKELIKMATNIIELIRKEYHLK